MYGLDTIYDPSANDNDLIGIALSQQRVLLTADRELFERALKKKIISILVVEESDNGKLTRIFGNLGIHIEEIDPEKSRCAKCNGTLSLTDKSSVDKSIPSGIIQKHQEFFSCHSCGKLYWKGSHWKRIESMAKEVRDRLTQT